jgi:hypothetical protein
MGYAVGDIREMPDLSTKISRTLLKATVGTR